MRFGSIGSRAGSRPLRSIEQAPRHRESGFTLLETLTALLILSIALVSLFDAQTRGLRAAAVTDTYAEARIIGESLLAEIAADRKGGLVPRRGRQGAYDWSISVEPAGAAWAAIKSKSWRLQHVRVTVAWSNSRSLVLDTLRLGRVNE